MKKLSSINGEERELSRSVIEDCLMNWNQESSKLKSYLPAVHQIRLTRKSCMEREPDSRKKIFIVKKGLLQASLLLPEQDSILGFHREGEWFGDCFAKTISHHGKIVFTALQETVLEYFYYDELKAILDDSIVANHLLQFILQQTCYNKSRHEQLLLLGKGKMRYSYFMETQSDLSLCLSSKKIAAYLGMTPESLSRIRKSMFLDAKSKTLSNAA